MGFESDCERVERTGTSTSRAADENAFGICEVITVPPNDELPYVFEITRGQTLSFSLSSSHAVDLVLCEESAYDRWIDAGFETERPLEALLVLRHGISHSLEFKPNDDTVLIAIVINYAEGAVESIVWASFTESLS